MSPITEAEGRAALDQIAAANRDMADRLKSPGWYSWSLSLLMGGIAAVQEAPVWAVFAYEAFFFVALALLVRAYKRETGVWIMGYRAGRTRWVAVGAAVLMVAVMLAGVFLYRFMDIRGACIAAGVILTFATRYYCRVWEQAYRRDLGVA
jgi:hypothetical protein